MNKKNVLTMVCLTAALVLTGCGNLPQEQSPDSVPNADIAATPAPTSPRQSYEKFTSIPSDVVEGFTKDLQKAFKKENWEMIASLIDYPITVDREEFKSKEEFLDAKPGKLIPQKIRRQIAKADVSAMKVTKKGAVLGNGELTIGDRSGLLRILEIDVKANVKDIERKTKS